MTDSVSTKNIYQKFLEVQKVALTVKKNETVKINENDKGYKAVTHDDVAALLHKPLAEAGIVMLPNVTDFSTTEFEKTNKWGNVVTWYRTDIKISVKWINADNPEDFFESTGAAFALDTSDKSFAKAYSLALKIVLLKVHLLESRDDEESRPFDEQNLNQGQNKGSNQSKKNQNQKQDSQPKNNSKPTEVQPSKEPLKTVVPFGSNKGKTLGDLDLDVINSMIAWLKEKVKENPSLMNFLLDAQAVEKIKAAEPLFNENELIDEPSEPENESQEPKNEVLDAYVIDSGLSVLIDLAEAKDKPLKSVSEKTLKRIIKELQTKMSEPNKLKGFTVTKLFEVQNTIKAFLKSMDVTP